MSTSTTRTPLRTAILGYGVSGRFFHGAYLRADPDYSVDVIATANAERAAQARADHPEVQVIADPAQIAELAEQLDLVIVCTPPSSHVALARTALRAGLDVVVDKPLAPSSLQAEALIAEAEALGRHLSVYQNRRFDADMLTLQELLSRGALGNVHTLESRFEWWKPGGERSWKAETPVADGGGILFDLGTHLIDQAILLLGPVDEILADVRPSPDPDTTSHLVLRHRGGASSRLTMSSLSAQAGPRFHVLGDAASWRSVPKDPQEDALRSGGLPGETGFGEVAADDLGELSDGDSVRRTPSARGDYGCYYRQLAAALRGEGALPVDPRDAVDVLRIVEAAHASSRTLLTPEGRTS